MAVCLHCIAGCGSMLHCVVGCGSMLHCVVGCSSMLHLSQYHTLHIAVRGLRIWPPNAAKCCKNAGKFFPDNLSLSNNSMSKLITTFCPLIMTLIGPVLK